MKLQLPKGTRDFPPEEKILRDKIVKTLIKWFEIYGFSPLDTPIFERLDILTAKYSAGEGSDISKEIFQFKDQGERELGLIFDHTLPMARFVGMNPTLRMPFKRYQIGKVFRDGPIKLGRYREFYQYDIDTVGTSSMMAEVEVLEATQKIFKELKLEITIEINNRKILNNILEVLKIEQKEQTLNIIDKLKKQGLESVKQELENFLSNEQTEALIKVITIKGNNKDKITKLKEILTNHEGLNEMEEILKFTTNITFNPTLARGLAYYTGPIFEVFLKDSEITSAVAGGGRYDKMIGNYLDNKKEYPATGIAFGIEPITEAIKLENPKQQLTKVKVFLIPIKTKCYDTLKQLRKNQIPSNMDLLNRSITKNLDYANKQGIPYVIIIGDKEKKENKYKLKNMETGEEQLLSIEEIIQCLR